MERHTSGVGRLAGGDQYAVRAVYINPEDRREWLELQERVQMVLEDLQYFFADEMRRHGYLAKTFAIANDASGRLKCDRIHSPVSSAEFNVNPVERCKHEAYKNGLRRQNDLVVYIYEGYDIHDGRFVNIGARGWNWRERYEVFISALHLKMARREWLTKQTGYDGHVFEWISAEPMSTGMLSWNGTGLALADVAGKAYGVLAHEMGHCFGLSHDFRDDVNRRGNLMGNGFRGMRGYFFPDATADFCRLTRHDTELLNVSAYFKERKLPAQWWARC